MSQLDTLWEYQNTELELAKLNKEMKSSPAYQKRSKLYKLLVEQQEIIKKYEADIDEHSKSIAVMESQIEELLHDYELENSELSAMESDEEVTAPELTEARKSIEKLVGRINGLNKELAKVIEWCEGISEQITNTYSKAGRAKKDYDAVRTVCDAEKDSFAPKLEVLQKKLEEQKAKIPPDLMKRYETLKKNYATPIAKVVNGQCGGCYMMLSSVQEKRVAAGNAVIQCENCGRLLFM